MEPRDDIAIAEARQLEASFARWLPTFSLRSTIAPSGPIRGNALESTSGTDLDALGDLADELGYQTNNQLRIVLPLYEFGKITVLRDLAGVGVEVARLERRKAELELVFNVRQAYLGLQLANAFDRLIREGDDRLQEARERLEERLITGEPGARTELRQLTIFEADFAGRSADNRILASLARRGLAFYCGIEGEFTVPRFDSELAEGELADYQTYLDLAWAHRPDVALLGHAVTAADYQVQAARRAMLPNFFFSLIFSFNHNPLADDQPTPFAYDPYNSGGIGFFVGLDWKFDFRQVARARRRAAEAERAGHRRVAAMGGMEIEIEQAYLQALGHGERADAYHAAHEAARAWLRQRSLQFDSGLADFDDLSAPLSAHYSAWANYYQALFDYRMAQADLALKLGLRELPDTTALTDDDEPAPE